MCEPERTPSGGFTTGLLPFSAGFKLNHCQSEKSASAGGDGGGWVKRCSSARGPPGPSVSAWELLRHGSCILPLGGVLLCAGDRGGRSEHPRHCLPPGFSRSGGSGDANLLLVQSGLGVLNWEEFHKSSRNPILGAK